MSRCVREICVKQLRKLADDLAIDARSSLNH